MTWHYRLIAGLCCAFACSLPAEPRERDVTYDCEDTRDGERFSFNTDTIRDGRIDLVGNRSLGFTVTDTEGQERHIPEGADAWLKCLRRKDPPE